MSDLRPAALAVEHGVLQGRRLVQNAIGAMSGLSGLAHIVWEAMEPNG